MKQLLSILLACFSIWFVQAQDATLEKTISFHKSAEEEINWQSAPIEINTQQLTPFIYISAYSEQATTNGEVYYRQFKNDAWSTWHMWEELPQEEGATRTVFKGLSLAADITTLQLKTTTVWEQSFQFRQFTPGYSTHSKNIIATSREQLDNCEQPAYCDRGCWCPDGKCPEDSTPVGTGVTHIVVHHSAADNRSNDFAAVVRSYWDFHVNTRGWDDIGYNWLIDANGVIYEGRGEGLLGAHFSCMNEETVGICLIGNFEEEKPTSEAIEALRQLVAWEVKKGKFDALGERYHVSSRLDLPTIVGHRDGGASVLSCSSTVCPGEQLYQELPILRGAVAALPCLDEVLTSTEKTPVAATVKVHPNPNKGVFTVSLNASATEEAAFSIMSMIGGQYDLGSSLITSGENDLSFSVRDIPSGFYYFTMRTNSAWLHQKIILLDN